MRDFKKNPTGREATELFNQYCSLYLNASVYGECAPYSIKELLGNEFGDRIREYSLKENEYSILTMSEYPTFHSRELQDFWERVKRIKATPSEKEKHIRNHYKSYSWMRYDYDGEEWSFNEIEEKFGSILDKKKNNIEVEFQPAEYRSIPGKRKQIVERLKLDQKTTLLAKLIRDSSRLMDIKKEYFSRIHHNTKPFFENAAEKLGIDRKYLSYILPYEYDRIMRSNNSAELIKRFQSSTVYINQNGCKIVEKLNIKPDRVKKGIKNCKATGLCAYPGKITGIVKIVRNDTDLQEFRNGEILVATMTTIDFLEAMKKALAIVTDDGGVICHAAIICREMRKPCIVGAKFATSVFFNGDYVSVDASNGIVHLIERN
jgi:phosphoenolpyruvate synthase/pyruvate phosphate dikinase